MVRLVLGAVFIILFPLSVTAAIEFIPHVPVEFSPARGETFEIPFVLKEEAQKVSLSIFTSDGDLVRNIASDGPPKPGEHKFVWDGKDENGIVVPDEAYVPVLKVLLADGHEVTQDPRETSGGELVEDIRVEITPSKDIAYYLSAPSRVLIRIGIKGGPMLRSLASWEPRGAGKNVQRWDGRDQNGLVDIRNEKIWGF